MDPKDKPQPPVTRAERKGPAMRPALRLFPAALLALLLPAAVRAELVELKVHTRTPYAKGVSFGDTGPYEVIAGVARFAIDPNDPHNRFIVDLDLAPKNAQGKVEFEADVYILAPKDPTKGNGALFYDVNNRGNKLALRMFNTAPGATEPGNGFLMRRGYTIVWCGWIGELLSGGDRMLLKAPIATDNGKPIRGMVRYETGGDSRVDSLPLSRRDAHGSYPPTEKGESDGVLTKRQHETDERVTVPREQWKLERLPVAAVKQGVTGTFGQVRLHLKGGFEPGYLYELVCEAEGPIVQGTGFAATRDLISFLRYDTSPRNPITGKTGKAVYTRAHGFGVSQSGRFLREFLYWGCNADEKGRIVFDGLMPHVAGGGLGHFNHRFAQPTRHNAQHEEHLYPTDRFPFTYGLGLDPFTKRADGILQRLEEESPKAMPKVMHTQSAAEYWHRSGSLVHTDPLGLRDADIPKNVRIYAFGGTQHGPAADPPPRGLGETLSNPGDYRPLLRALLDALDAWVRDGKEPPPSVYPRIDQRTLVHWWQGATGFPFIPGVNYPQKIQQPSANDHGKDFYTKGRLTALPPRRGADYIVRVPKSGDDGNDLGCLLPPEVVTPLATYTGWNVRRADVGAGGALVSLMGSYIPFSRTKAERLEKRDPRPSLEERYGGYENYLKQFSAGCADLVQRRYLLSEDARRLIEGRGKVRPLFGGVPQP
jgi:hypothetical protein